MVVVVGVEDWGGWMRGGCKALTMLDCRVVRFDRLSKRVRGPEGELC